MNFIRKDKNKIFELIKLKKIYGNNPVSAEVWGGFQAAHLHLGLRAERLLRSIQAEPLHRGSQAELLDLGSQARHLSRG
jgi:hypothetical protein